MSTSVCSWWNQRKREGALFPQATVAFTGDFVAGDQVFVNIGGQECGKTVFPNESAAVVARHFEYFINANYVGVWARATDSSLVITSRSPKPVTHIHSKRRWMPSRDRLALFLIPAHSPEASPVRGSLTQCNHLL